MRRRIVGNALALPSLLRSYSSARSGRAEVFAQLTAGAPACIAELSASGFCIHCIVKWILDLQRLRSIYKCQCAALALCMHFSLQSCRFWTLLLLLLIFSFFFRVPIPTTTTITTDCIVKLILDLQRLRPIYKCQCAAIALCMHFSLQRFRF